jgi:YhcH/YjgK/YiaL family protein
VQLGDGVVVKVVDYETNPPERKRWEAHRKCVDVHLLVAGEELFGFADVSSLEPVTEYDEQEDVILLEKDGQGECDYVRLTPGTFAIAYPQDAHKPGIVADAKGLVRKIVVKLPV